MAGALGRAGLALALAAGATAATAEEIVPGSPRAAQAQALVAREKAEWDAYRRKDRAALIAETPADFADLYSDGQVVDRRRWLDDMERVDVLRFALSDFHAFALSDDAMLLTYRGEAWARAKADGRALHNVAAVTSAWARRGDRWLNVFYGEAALTPDSVSHVAPPAPH
jgi:hypothetical protein